MPFLAAAQSTAPKDELVIGIREFLSDLPAMIAAADGLYAAEGAKVRTVTRPQGRDNLLLMLDGTLDLVLVGGHMGRELFPDMQKGGLFVVLASLGGGGRRWRLMASEKSGIVSLEGLKDKRIGVWPSAYGYHLFERHLAAKGIRHSTVRIPMDPEKAVAAMEKEKLDAIFAWEPIPAMLEDKKLAREIFSLDSTGAGVPIYLVARKEAVRKKPEALATVLRTLDKAIATINKNPDEAARRGSALTRIPAKILKKALRNHEFRLGLTCAQRNELYRAACFGVKGPCSEPDYDTAPLRAHLQRAGAPERLEENCPALLQTARQLKSSPAPLKAQ